MPKTVTVTITGPQGSGKTRTGNMLRDALLNAGAVCGAEKCGDDCESPESLWHFPDRTIRIVEKQGA